MSPVPCSQRRMRCAQCWMLDCTIPAASTGEAVIRSCLEEPSCSLWRGRGHCSALLRAPPLIHSSPFLPSVTLFLPHLFTPCSVRLVGGAHASGIVASHCSPTDRAPHLSRRDTAELFFPYFFLMPSPGESTACTPVQWRARACSHQRRRRIYLRVRCPHTVRAISLPRTHIWTSPIVTEEEKGKHTGLQGWGSTALWRWFSTKWVGSLLACHLQRVPVSDYFMFDSLCRPHYLWRASRGRLCGHCGGWTAV